MNAARIAHLVTRIQNDYLETPSLRLTALVAQRRYQVSAYVCRAVMKAMVESGVLEETPTGSFVRFFPLKSASEYTAPLLRHHAMAGPDRPAGQAA